MKLHTYQLTKFGSNRTSTFQMRLFSAYLTTWPHMTFDLNIWPLTLSTNEGSHVVSMTQLWFKSIKACRAKYVNPFSQQQTTSTTTDNNKVIPIDVCFLLRQATQKLGSGNILIIFRLGHGMQFWVSLGHHQGIGHFFPRILGINLKFQGKDVLHSLHCNFKLSLISTLNIILMHFWAYIHVWVAIRNRLIWGLIMKDYIGLI